MSDSLTAGQSASDEETASGAGASGRDDARLVAGLRDRDEAAFRVLVERYQRSLLRLAQTYVADAAVAEEVVQETWLGVLAGLDRFEARSSLKTWMFRILINRAKTRGAREGRSIPFSAFGEPLADAGDPAIDPDRFFPPDEPHLPGQWITPPREWDVSPEDWVLTGEVYACLRDALAVLPAGQRAVITLRDVEGWASAEVCHVLGISETNQRVLLHRARTRVRFALEGYFDRAREHADGIGRDDMPRAGGDRDRLPRRGTLRPDPAPA
jgi:RNA polymerase sigma-70 factor (ECF subfamily)